MYKRNKDITELTGRLKLHLPHVQYLHVYVWNNMEAMYKNNVWEKNNYEGCYNGLSHTKRKFGEIHLVKGEFGGGLFAHELQHFLLHWVNEPPPHGAEEICLLAGNLTAEFWGWFWEAVQD